MMRPVWIVPYDRRAEIKGATDDAACCVLCTPEKTFSLKQLETSNTLLITPPDSQGGQANIEGNNEGRVEVVATARCTYELSRIGAPAAGHARAILASKSQRCTSEQADDVPLRSDRDIYVAEDGNSFDDDIASELVHMEKLRSNVSASEAEICTELRESGAVEFHASDGSQWWWLPPQGYFCQLADIALPAIQANGNELSDADASALEQTLAREDGYRKEIVRAFLRQYACHKHGNIWSIDLAAIARAKARFLLMYTKVQYLHEFLQAWRERCTDDCAEYVSTDLLEGLAIVETSRNGQSSVVALFEDQLPLDRKQRFSALFNARDRWEWSALKPYVQRLEAAHGQSIEQLLLKYTRKLPAAQQGNTSADVYVRRHT